MGDQLWDLYERVGDAIGDHLDRFAFVIAAVAALLLSVGFVAG